MTSSPLRRNALVALALAGTVVLFAACGTSGGADAGAVSTSSIASDDGAATSITEPGADDDGGNEDGRSSLDRAALRASLDEALAETSLDPTDDQVDCYTDSLIDEVGLERLDALGVPAVDPLAGVVLGSMTTNIDDAAAYFTPMFTCLDGDLFVRSSLPSLPAAVEDCVVDAVLADREVRVIYVLGTKKGADPDPDVVRMTAPLLERSFEIEAECQADS